jgi:hypothetical protein
MIHDCSTCKNINDDNTCNTIQEIFGSSTPAVCPNNFSCSLYEMKVLQSINDFIKKIYFIPKLKENNDYQIHASDAYQRYSDQYYTKMYEEMQGKCFADSEYAEMLVTEIYRSGYENFYKTMRISAIKMCKFFTGYGLKESKDYCEILFQKTGKYLKLKAIEEL